MKSEIIIGLDLPIDSLNNNSVSSNFIGDYFRYYKILYNNILPSC